MHEPRVTTRVRRPGAGVGGAVGGGVATADAVTEEWPLGTLIAFLFEGRECDEVRALLARGHATARGAALWFDPIELTPDEFAAVEREFPRSDQAPPPDLARASTVALAIPALSPTLAVPIRADQPLVRAAALRAAHLRFDYGPWADVYIATLTRAEAAELLDDPARRATDAGEAELAKRVVGEDDVGLMFTVPREDAPAPWLREGPPPA